MSNPATVQSTMTAGVQTYRGSCHCGALCFEIDFDPSAGTVRCNCTVCKKTGWWCTHLKPSALRVVSGQESLGCFSRDGALRAHFCKVCGIRLFARGDHPELGGEFCSVNLNCLDGADLSGVSVAYVDGLHDTWELIAVAPYVDPFTSVKRDGRGAPRDVPQG